jgi:putative membrane-bound dehydrogenase-like protein
MKRWPHVLLLSLTLGFPTLVLAQVPPEKALSTFKTVEGLELSLWASEPLFVNPTCMDVDHKGRVWVCESINYRSRLRNQPLRRKEGDRILILEDSKGTGQADKVTVFYQAPEILAPLGIAVAKDPVGPGYKVFVCQSPDILVFTDSKGEGKADGPPQKLLTGFNGFDHDHGVHGILIGPDMKLYFSVGDTGVKNLQSSDGKGRKFNSNDTDCRAGTIWRCNLDGTKVELIAHNFRNEYEPCVDSFGTVFVSDNDDDGNQQTRICYVMPGGNYGYHPRGPGQTHWHEEQPGVVPKILRTYFGSPTGICVYEGTLLPKKYHGQLLHTDAGPRHVRCYHLKPNGGGYEVDREDMVTSTDNWFRPSDVCVGPDGSVYIADWYDPGVGGHGMGDTTRGRVFRLAPPGHKPAAPAVDLETHDGILKALASPALSVRYMAMAKLALLPKAEVVEVLKPALKQTENRWLRARALWQLSRTQGWNGVAQVFNLQETAEGGQDEQLRILCMRILKDSYDIAPGANYKLKGPTPAVAREALLLMRDVEPGKVKEAIYELAKLYDGKDRFYLCAVGIAVGHHDKARRDVFLADFEKYFPEWNDKVAGLVWELRPPSIVPLLAKRLFQDKLPNEQRAQMVDIIAASDDPNAGGVLLKLLQSEQPAEVRAKVLDNLKLFLPGKWRGLRQSRDMAGTIENLLNSPEGRETGLMLVAVTERVESLGIVTALARDTKQPATLRKTAIHTLGLLPSVEAAKALKTLLKTEPATLRTDALQALGRLSSQNRPEREPAIVALNVLQELLADPQAPLQQRLDIVGALAGSRPGTEWLLALHARKELGEDLKPETARLLRNSPHQDLRNKAMIAFPPPGRLDPKKLPAITSLAARRGDIARGKTLLAASVKADTQCLKCHTIRGSGGQVGPDLSMIGKKASRENLFESILYPSKAIADQYLTWQIETTKGQVVAGLLVEETKEAVTIRDGNGKDTRISVKDIDSRTKSPKSLMPEDLLVYMTEDDLVDMVEYLFTLKTPVLGMDYWYIVGPFDNGADDKGLDEIFGPEKGIDLKATYPGKAGKVAWKTVKPDARGYVDLQAYYAPNSDQIVSYLYREVESPADQDAMILLGADDGCKLWVNDKLVHSDRRHVAAVPEADTVKVKLVKGKNRLLFKINNGDGAHGFYLTIVAEQELKRLESK